MDLCSPSCYSVTGFNGLAVEIRTLKDREHVWFSHFHLYHRKKIKRPKDLPFLHVEGLLAWCKVRPQQGILCSCLGLLSFSNLVLTSVWILVPSRDIFLASFPETSFFTILNQYLTSGTWVWNPPSWDMFGNLTCEVAFLMVIGLVSELSYSAQG